MLDEYSELTDEEILALPVTEGTFNRHLHLNAEMAEYLLPKVRHAIRRIERLQCRIQRWQSRNPTSDKDT